MNAAGSSHEVAALDLGPTGDGGGRAGLRCLLSPAAAGVILLGFWLLLIASLWSKSLTVDEGVHAVAGYSYWRFHDYRLNPENGILPQRWFSLPLLAGGYAFPSTESTAWLHSDEGTIADQWFHRLGNDPVGMLRRGRAMSGLLAVALGALIWWWARRLFGPVGGLVSLLVFVLNPTILANGALMTSDTACALFFLGSLFGIWRLLERVSVGGVILAGAFIGGLFASKMSAILIFPLAVALAAIRVFSGPPISWEIGRRRSLVGWRSRGPAVLAVGAALGAMATAVIWGFYGFRYSAFAPGLAAGGHFEYDWSELLGAAEAAGRPVTARIVGFLHAHRLLPEAYLYGQAQSWKFSRIRSAFLNGRYSLTGWWWFFPYTFLVKTPLAVMGLMALALAATRRRQLYEMIPLALLFIGYWAAAVATPLNIGHRHILTTYPPLFVWCGAAGAWWSGPAQNRGRGRAPGLILAGLIAALALEAALCFPSYLSYFNVVAGGSSNGYRHLVDSSLDWGQDLPALKRYLEGHPGDRPAFLSYFGTASPDSYQLPATYLYSVRGQDVPPAMRLLDLPADQARAQLADLRQRHPEYQVVGGSRQPGGRLDFLLLDSPEALRLRPGTYFISATMLQSVMYALNGPVGSWNPRYERNYQSLAAAVKPLLTDDLAIRDAALPRHPPAEWATLLADFDAFRFARLAAYLRQAKPADTINGSILVYRLSQADIGLALDGLPPELGPDLPLGSGLLRVPVSSP